MPAPRTPRGPGALTPPTVDPQVTPFSSALRWAVHALVYLLVVLALVRAVRDPLTTSTWQLAGLLALFVAVYSLGARWNLRHRRGAYGSWHALAYLVPSVLLWGASFALTPDPVWIAFGLDFAVLYALPPVGGLMGLAVVTAMAITGFTLWSPSPAAGEVLGPMIGALVALAVVTAVRALQREVDQRTRLATALARARDTIEEQSRAAASAAERDRIARELHDTVAQSTLSVHLLLDATGSALAREDTAEARILLQEARAATARTAGQTRRFVDAAEVDLTTGEDLRTELARILEHATGTARGQVTLRDDLSPAEHDGLPRSTARAVLRLVESLVANAVQHSDADRTVVSLDRHGDRLLLDVVDDGRGFDPARQRGFGLRSAAARAASVGGTLTIESAPGQGTAVQVSLPVPVPEEGLR